MSNVPLVGLDASFYDGGQNYGLGSWPWRRARINADAVALAQHGREVTYRQLAERTARLAASLLESGLAAGGRVAYLGPNDISAFEVLFATGLAGGVFVPLNTRLAAPEIAYMLGDSAVSVLVVAAGHAQTINEIAVLPASLATVLSVTEADLQVTHQAYEQFLAAGQPGGAFPAVDFEDPCLILYTSGTTGAPKGAVLTHRNVTFNTVNQLAHFDVSSTDRTLCLAPLFHVTGLGQVTLPTLFKGGLVLPVTRFDAGEVLSVITAERITGFSAVPTILQMLCDHPSWPDTDLSSLRTVVYGGSPVQERVAVEWLRRGVPLLQGYGMTEAAAGVYMATGPTATGRPTAIGVPHFFTDVAMVEQGRERPPLPGQSGELVVRGPHMFAGYWNRENDTAAALTPQGWYRTGDVIAAGEDGLAAVVDRVKDIIISGGENIYPVEVEAALERLPGVGAAAVVGVPDDKWGEVGLAYIVPQKPGFDEAATRVALGAALARYKIPKFFQVIETIPRNATGKIKRNELRSDATDLATKRSSTP
ncbi:AMP-binding protein [Mycolicibacterium neoaurum]|uniref:AMP-binding protein n=1 Tax=Mycolicibacterium neoaurum TaxID=1795 RepID=UPI001BD1422D|nr:AMP-binding protein [Mycolicibacterium neoaurum]QVI27254.1 AMP-binding protein [Mycolicibacterium neoaurum]